MDEGVIGRIREDLASFADPGLEVEVDSRGATWMQNRNVVQVQFVQGDGLLPEVQCGDRTFTYESFFASDLMADLPAVAESQLHYLHASRNYVEGPGKSEDTSEEAGLTDLILGYCTKSLPFRKTRVTFLKGNAGAGKTYALRRLAHQQARRVCSGDARTLFLYVDAQAKSLARLDEAVAALLQDLRASFTYRALATLTRLRLVVPIIDGFDELIGTGGRGEAFNSLALFLSRLNGDGAVVASARSTFLEVGEFRETAKRYESTNRIDFEIVTVEALPWQRRHIERYLEASGTVDALEARNAQGAYDELAQLVGEGHEAFLHTPFFVASLVELLRGGWNLSAGKRLVPQVIDYFIERERQKVRGSEDRPIAAADDHRKFLELIAEEMWWQESREIDVDTLRALAELTVDGVKLSPKERITFVEKATTYAFLETRTRSARTVYGFTHEYFYSYFVAQFFVRCMGSPGELRQALSRGSVAPTIGLEFGYSWNEREFSGLEAAAAIFSRRVPTLTKELDLENAGSLLFGLIRAFGPRLESAKLGPAILVGADLQKSALVDASFVDSELVRCDLRGARWNGVQFVDSRLVEPLISEYETRLEGSRLEVGGNVIGLVVGGAETALTLHDPAKVEEILRRIGASVPQVRTRKELSGNAKHLVALLKRVLRFASRRFYFSEEDLHQVHISTDPKWQDLEGMLKRTEVMERVKIQKRGPSGEVFRLLVPPSELERGEGGGSANAKVLSFWEEMYELP